MYINAQELLYLVGAICLLWITGFLCWALYETARMMRKANEVVTETQDRLHEIEDFVDDVVDKLTSFGSYFGALSNVSSKVMGMLGHHDEEEEIRPRKKLRRAKRQLLDDEM
ncbi:hypothetical protein IT087_02440 [Candidatus Uhrbacteria bacterium]|nr:hypothetical protein [Candidatus Uhrbacteria bacterium]